MFNDEVTADRSNRMNSEVYRALLSAQIQPNAEKLMGPCLTVQMDIDRKHCESNTRASSGKEI